MVAVYRTAYDPTPFVNLCDDDHQDTTERIGECKYYVKRWKPYTVRLRIKLLLGYAVFIAALVLLGGWSAWRIRAMGQVSQRILADNYESVITAQEMKESFQRQDSAALFVLLSEHKRADTQLQAHRQRFDAAFRRAANNITEPGEPEVIEAIRRERDAYYALFDALLTEREGPPGDADVDVATAAAIARHNSAYFSRLAPAFDRLRATVIACCI